MNIINLILYGAGLVLMVLGAVEVIRWLSVRAHMGTARQTSGQIALVVCPTSPEDCEALVRAAGESLGWTALPCRLICVDCGDGEARQIVERLKLRYRELELVVPEELNRALGGK